MPLNKIVESRREAYLVSTDLKRLDIGAIHQFLTHSYWAEGRSRETVARSIENSLCFGLHEDKTQIGFARVATDFAVYAYLMDVYVLEPYQKKGLGAWLLESVLAHPELQTVKWVLGTKDAHGFYEKCGFTRFGYPERLMERKPMTGILPEPSPTSCDPP
jgi:GNAT superfamily N-acetyltransferase